MAISDFDEYINKLSDNRSADFVMNASVGRAGRLSAAWRGFVIAPPTRTTPVALDKSSDEAIGPLPLIGSGSLQLLGARLAAIGGSGLSVVLVDLLNLQGGINSSITGSQTTNLPTAALTRYTSGVGVMAGVYIQNQVGSTATTFTVGYTNQAGTSGQTSTATAIGSTGFRETGSIIPIPLAIGDTGVKSVDSINLAASIGGTAIGVCLFKPLAVLSMESFTGRSDLDMVSTGGVIGQFAEINPDACLTLMLIQSSAQFLSGSIILNEV
jgi:hypothetical protein